MLFQYDTRFHRGTLCRSILLHLALQKEHIEVAIGLLEVVVKVCKPCKGMTRIELACNFGMGEIVKWMLDAGVDPNVQGRVRPLEQAIVSGMPEVVQLLVDAGAKAHLVSLNIVHYLRCKVGQIYPYYGADWREILTMLESSAIDERRSSLMNSES